MLTFSLVAVLLYGMKSFGHEVVSQLDILWANCMMTVTVAILGRRYSDRYCNGCLFWILARHFRLSFLHCVFIKRSIGHYSSVLNYSEFLVVCISTYLEKVHVMPRAILLSLCLYISLYRAIL